MILTKTKLKEYLEGDYIPNGENVGCERLIFRETAEDEIYRCSQKIGSDTQSGPFYCGDVADWIASSDKGLVCFCGNHRNSAYGRTVKL